MRKSSQQDEERRSFRLLGIFLVLVSFFIAVSLIIKSYFLIQHSTYDGLHRFVVLFEEKNSSQIVSLEPEGDSAIILFSLPASRKDVVKRLSLPIDATIQTTANFSKNPKLSSLLATALLDPVAHYVDMTRYDLLRLYLLSLHLDDRDIQRASIVLSSTTAIPDPLKKNFLDNGIASDNQSIAIENASGISGLGQKLEEGVAILGGSVVSVTTARLLQKPTYIYFSGKRTYTVKRLERLLRQQAEEGDTGIADIRVIIGERSATLDEFGTLTPR